MSVGLYSLNVTREFSCRIPKKSGNGYLASAFGWHSRNAAADQWGSERPKVITNGDYCDLDGYLAIVLTLYRWESGFEDGIEDLKRSLTIVFPHISEWREVSFGELVGV